MTLAAPVPDWVIELGAVAGEACERLRLAVPGSSGWHLRSSVAGDVLVVSVNVASGERATAQAAALVLAPLWPGWLSASGVGLSLVLPSVVVSCGAVAMDSLAHSKVSPGEWWLAASVERRVT